VERLHDQLKAFPSFVVVESDLSEEVYSEAAKTFAPLVEKKVLETEAAREEAVQSKTQIQELSAKWAAARQLLEQFATRTREAEQQKQELEDSLSAAESLIEGISEEFQLEGLMASVAAIAATHPEIKDLPQRLALVESLPEAVQVAKDSKIVLEAFDREPLGIRDSRIDEALAASQQKAGKLLEEQRNHRSGERREDLTTKTVVVEMQRLGLK